jgi:uncharacterized protein (TIGR03382 family)
MLMLGWCSLAMAGYGDARDGLPTHEDREVFFWTNAVRVDPPAFRSEVPCDFDRFAAGEKTPKAPLLYSADLTDAAFYHSDDMRRDGYFDHDSNDGTSWSRRIYRYYDGTTIAENIAWGYSSPYEAVIGGWMCSSGHRANLMSANYNELGAGVSGTYFTQDFGYRAAAPERAMTMGIHLPRVPAAEVTLYVDWSFDTAPDALFVVLDGVRHDLDLVIGTDTRGVWGTTTGAPGGCQSYWFQAEAGGRTETFPEDGSYGFGDCAWDDPAAEWLAGRVLLDVDEPPVEDTGTVEPDEPGTEPPPSDTGGSPTDSAADELSAPQPTGCGCDGTGVQSLAAAWLSAWLLRRRR